MSEQLGAPKFEATKNNEKEKQPKDFLEKLIADPKVKSVIDLVFVRHSIAWKKEGVIDKDRELTLEGGKIARAKSEEILDTDQVAVIGSPRKRTGHTGSHILVGNEEEFTGEEDFDTLMKHLDEVKFEDREEKKGRPRKFGSRVGTSEDLDYYINPESDYYKNHYNPSIRNKNYLEAFVNGSDEKAKEAEDEITSTYTRQAQQGARLVKRYEKASPQWSRFLERHKDEQSEESESEKAESKKQDKVLQRLLPNHMGVGECFLAKAIKLTEGVERRDELVAALSKDGFDYVEYFKVFIVDHEDDGQKLFIEYKHKNKDGTQDFEFVKEIEPSLIEEILNERK